MLNLFKTDVNKKEKTIVSSNTRTNTINTVNREEEQLTKIQNIQNLIYNIPIKNIAPNPNQPRREFDERSLYGLAQSIKDYGIIQPLSVRLANRESVTESGDNQPVYELISGERRLRAAVLLFMETVPCVIINADRQISAEMAIIENLQREDLNFFEQARAVQKLIEMFGYTQEQTARRLSVSQSYIANKLRILKLSKEEQNLITEYGLTERHARSVIRIQDDEERKNVLNTVIKRAMNVSSTDKYIDKIIAGKEKEITREKNPRQTIIVKDIRLFLNTIDKAVDTVAQSGIDIKSEKTDKGEYIEICLTVPKRKA
ncbi:MAG: ParB/RepB/Spo0J family partition protein [Oscillospiraceae bacterium]|nr:ParB/RepB/Spo0J family partition protein [Oscillospiraceae bacterium]